MPTNTEKVLALVADLRTMAADLEAKAHTVPDDARVYTSGDVPISFHVDHADQLVAVRRWLGGHTSKDAFGDTLVLAKRWGTLVANVFAPRDEVCEQVAVGTRPVDRPDETSVEYQQVADLEAKLVEARAAVPTVTVDEPVHEWRCAPVLASVPDAVAS